MARTFFVLFGAGFVVSVGGCSDNDSGNNNGHDQCGNGVAEESESCDGTDLSGHDCTTIGVSFTGGTLACLGDCSGWDTSNCMVTANCGNAQIDSGETCDGTNLDNNDCTTIGMSFTDGTLACLGDCSGWDTSGCYAEGTCGDGVLDVGESCDSSEFGGTTCLDYSCTGGVLSCASNCTIDLSTCTGCTSQCDNGIVEIGEACDGTNLNNQTCSDFGYPQGVLVCNMTCDGFLLGGCYDFYNVCGDGVADGFEFCDGTDLGSWTCEAFHFTGGTLACTNQCQLDTIGCTGDVCQERNWYSDGGFCDPCEALGGTSDPDCQALCGVADGNCVSWFHPFAGMPSCVFATGSQDPDCGTCGDGVIDINELGEYCDGNNLGGNDCIDLGYLGGILDCAPNCTFDVSQCDAPTCGDGTAEAYEQCDGADLRNNDCSTIGQGFNQGTLACNANCNDWNTSGCSFLCSAINLGNWTGNQITEVGNTCNGSSEYDPHSTGCTGWQAAGYETLYSLTLAGGASVNITYSAGTDNSLYVLEDCADTTGVTCVVGVDANVVPPYEESVVLTNPTSGSVTYYIVLDNFGTGDCSAYTLEIT